MATKNASRGHRPRNERPGRAPSAGQRATGTGKAQAGRGQPPRPANPRRGVAARRQQARRRGMIAAVTVVAGAILALVGLLAFSNTGSTKGFRAEKATFDLPALTGGGHVRLADHAGHPVVVNFFASWCVYCNQELPGFVQVADATRGKVDFIAVDTDDTGDGAAMADRFGLAAAGFSLAHDIGPSPSSQLWSKFGGQGLPVTAFYDANGHQVDFSGGMLTQPELESRIKSNFGIAANAPDAAKLAAPVIPVIPQGAIELLRTHTGDPDFVTMDVRTPAEFATGHIPGAVNIDFDNSDFRSRLSGLSKDKTYLVYCHTGNRSGQATTLMHTLGFKHIYDVQGGVQGLEQAGMPLTR